MIKKIVTFFALVSIGMYHVPVLYAANCIPKFRGDYSVEANCTWPGNYKVYGNIYVGTRTITVPTGRTIGINLASQRATFSSGKILFQGNSKMQNTSANGYYIAMSHTANSGFQNCPSGMNVLNMTPSAYHGSTVLSRPTSGVFYCGK